ncbi:hypothetical protein HS1_000385 [Candidatus Desulfofervidus auxilii]|uniref:DUF362 domain-containing protein n=1 Tax=Desulfofervidus auxilii TaxID=1621989 RepID=A0A7U4QIY2_DESA2|nr:DUF362 domain-containing protein [Candidatus Desulfofervidus auxilii]AMM40191.1 hypothetical protein HS1_000385 [Candidatus Desulfofervidus auxilii]CAD7770813.1 hypothetical protein BLFGPEAP_00446 [Candidatus Methanoperedenaceae archaeon GB50]
MNFTRRLFLKILTLAGAILYFPFNKKNKIFAFPELDKSIYSEIDEKSYVICVHNPNATSWDYKTGYYIEYINQEEINKMLDKALLALTGEKEVYLAWKNVMSKYKPGDKIALKPNFNCADKPYARVCQEIMTAPQVINTVIKGLTQYIGVPEKDIYIYDLCRPIPYNIIRKYIPYNVNFIEKPSHSILDRIKIKLKIGLAAPDMSGPIEMREKITDSEGNFITCYIPKLLTECQHLINLPIVKYHQFLVVTGPLKNHFGTVRFSNLSLYPVYLHGKVLHKSIVDLNRNPHIKNKTRLVVADFLFGSYDYKTAEHKTEVKRKWKTFPMGETPNCLLVSKDPVALESVMYFYLIKERKFHGLPIGSDHYLYDAMKFGLGIHERVESEEEFKSIKLIKISI